MVKRLFNVFAAVATVAALGLLAVLIVLNIVIPDKYYVSQGSDFSLDGGPLGIKSSGWAQNLPKKLLSTPGNEYSMQLSLPGGAVIKTVSVQVVERNMVIPAGTPFGIKMFTDGVMVVGLSDFDISGRAVNPAKSAGIKTGDIITSVDGQQVSYNEDVGRIISESGGREVKICFMRSGEKKETTLTPVKSPVDGSYRAGMWVRDSSAGIGTMTYYDPQQGTFAGLGHAICDVDTGEVMPLSSGEAVEVTITGVSRGSSGFPGELRGVFASGRTIGCLTGNDETGIYGKCDYSPSSNKPVPIANRGEIHTGDATIYTTVSGSKPQAYNIRIERIAATDANPTKNMVIRITDPRLIEVTGGIVQGMSGSPIIQDGKLVGAVTHVFVNDPCRGYGIFVENMAQAAKAAA